MDSLSEAWDFFLNLFGLPYIIFRDIVSGPLYYWFGISW